MNTLKSDQRQVRILGIKVDITSSDRLLADIGKKLEKKEKFKLFTPNPEIILQAQNDRNLSLAIDNSDFSIPDGIGLKIFANHNLEIIHGRVILLDILKMANERNLKAFFIASDEKDTKNNLLKRLSREFPKVMVKAVVGPRLDKEANPISEVDTSLQSDIVNEINEFRPDLLFVAFGAPKQEIWITKWLPKLNTVGAFGVGGALDYYAGAASLPPKWMQKLELEWLWRLVSEPRRLRRIINAAIVFPLKLWIYKNRFFDNEITLLKDRSNNT